MNKIDLQNDLYEIQTKAHGIRDLTVLMDLGAADGQDIGDALTPLVDVMADFCDQIDKLYEQISVQTDNTAEQ